jgi:hypothetical protein
MEARRRLVPIRMATHFCRNWQAYQSALVIARLRVWKASSSSVPVVAGDGSPCPGSAARDRDHFGEILLGPRVRCDLAASAGRPVARHTLQLPGAAVSIELVRTFVFRLCVAPPVVRLRPLRRVEVPISALRGDLNRHIVTIAAAVG